MATSTALQAIPTLSPGENINAYMSAIGNFDVLSKKREQELGRKLVREGDLEDRQRAGTVTFAICGSYRKVLQRLWSGPE